MMMAMMQQMLQMQQAPARQAPAPVQQPKGVPVLFSGVFGTIKGYYDEVIAGTACTVLVSRADSQQMFSPPVSCDTAIGVAVDGGSEVPMYNVGLGFCHGLCVYTILMGAA